MIDIGKRERVATAKINVGRPAPSPSPGRKAYDRSDPMMLALAPAQVCDCLPTFNLLPPFNPSSSGIAQEDWLLLTSYDRVMCTIRVQHDDAT